MKPASPKKKYIELDQEQDQEQELHLSQNRFKELFVIWGTALAVFFIYFRTAAPGAWWGDGQELACAAWTLGIPHPTGYPLYTVTGHLLMKLFRSVDPGRVLTLFSAALLAVSCGMLVSFYRDLLKKNYASGAQVEPENGIMGLLPAVGLALLIAFSRTLWEQATFAEVYPLTFFFGVCLLRLAMKNPDQQQNSSTLRQAQGRQSTSTSTKKDNWTLREIRYAALIGAVFGLAALNHYSVIAFAPLVFLCVARWAWTSGRRGSVIFITLTCFAIVLCGYLYLPLRARHNPALNWGDPSSLEHLAWVLKGGQFTQLKTAGTIQSAGGGIGLWLTWWGTQWLPVRLASNALGALTGFILVVTAIAGLARLTFRRWELGLGLLGAMLTTACFAALYQIPDIENYFVIALPPAMSGWASAFQWGVERIRNSEPAFLRRPLFHVLPVVAALAIMVSHYGVVDKSWDSEPCDWGAQVMQALPRDAVVFCAGDADIYCLWYQQMALGKRPDVSVVGTNFTLSGWYKKYFEHPGRPRVPITIEERPPFQYKFQMDAYTVKRLIEPTLTAGRPAFLAYQDAVLFSYLNLQSAAPLMSPRYKEFSGYPEVFLPSPMLFKVEPNPKLETMSEEQLAEEFKQFYLRQAAAQRGMQ